VELETHLLLSQRVELSTPEAVEPLLELSDRVSRLLTGLRKALEQRL
jgi:hypothetical protein